jgi:hypothetical protein
MLVQLFAIAIFTQQSGANGFFRHPPRAGSVYDSSWPFVADSSKCRVHLANAGCPGGWSPDFYRDVCGKRVRKIVAVKPPASNPHLSRCKTGLFPRVADHSKLSPGIPACTKLVGPIRVHLRSSATCLQALRLDWRHFRECDREKAANLLNCVAGTQGFEPRYADPESAVLPLDDVPMFQLILPHAGRRNPGACP